MTTSIFLSYGRGDDDPDFYDPAKSFMRRLYNALKKEGFVVWWDREDLPNRGLSFLQEIRDAVTAHDKLVLVVGEKGMASDYVRAEWEYALSICKTVVPLLRNGDYNLMPPEIALANAPDFRDLSLFDHKLAELVRLLNENDAPMGTLYGVSDLPRGYIERKADMQAVSAMIRSDAVKPTVVTAVGGRAAALYGLGGIGKTTLTRALCYDCDLRRSFPDGIIWLEIGKNPPITSRQGDIGAIFDDLRSEYVDENRGKSRLSQILSGKRALIVLDDVWEQQHVEPFRAIGQNCRLLVTTRSHRLARNLGANSHALDKLTEDEGLRLIAARFNKTYTSSPEIALSTSESIFPPLHAMGRGLGGGDDLIETLRQIIRLLEGHTQAISIAAAKLEEFGLAFAPRLLERMQKRRDGDNPFKDLVMEETDKNANLELSLSLSYDDLKPDLQRRFRALGILTPDGSFDTALAAALWNDTDDNLDDTENALNDLVQKGLLIRETVSDDMGISPPLYAVERGTGGEDDSPHPETDSPITAHSLPPSLVTEGNPRGTGEGRGGGQNVGGVSPRFSQHNLLRAYARALLHRAGELDSHFARYADYIIERCEGFLTLPPEQWGDLEADAPHILYIGDTLQRYTANTPPDSDLENRALQFANNITRYLAKRREIQRIAWLDMGLSIARQRGEQQRESLFLNELALVYNDLGEKGKALDYYQQALPLDRAVGNRGGEATTLNNLGLVYNDLGEKGKALDYYQQALPLYRAVGNRGGEATTLNNLGSVYDDLGEKGKALEYYEQALPLRRAVGDRGGEAATLNNLGGVYSALGEKAKALDYYEQALPLRRAVGDRGGEATTLNNLGGIYSALGEKGKALEYYEQALPLYRAVGNRGGEAATLNNLGGVYSGLGEKGKALEYYEQALPLRRAVGDRGGEATTLNNLGLVYDTLGEKAKALDYYEQALPLYRAVGNRGGEATTLSNKAYIYLQRGEISRAVDIAGELITVFQAIGDVASETATRKNRAFALQQLNRLPEAIAEVEQSIAILQRYNLPQDAAGATLAEHEALLAQLRGEPPPLPSSEQALAMLKKLFVEKGEVEVERMLAEAGMDIETIAAILAQLRGQQ